MPTWDPDRYLRFADERGRPFVDLISRVPTAPATIVDLGCGPGQLTRVLRARWPEASVLGVDASSEMIARARRDNEDDRASYVEADVSAWAPAGPVDLIVSNAMFQWVPDQLAVIRRLLAHVAPGGAFALQVPDKVEILVRPLQRRHEHAEHAVAGLDRERGAHGHALNAGAVGPVRPLRQGRLPGAARFGHHHPQEAATRVLHPVRPSEP